MLRLAPYFYEKCGGFYYVKNTGGSVVWTHLGRDRGKAERLMEMILDGASLPSLGLGKNDAVPDKEMSKQLASCFYSARTNAKTRGVEFSLIKDDVFDMYKEGKGCCALTMIPFSLENYAQSRRRPFIPSIDRIDPKGTYVKDNVRLVCWGVNSALLDWGEDVFDRLARAWAIAQPKRDKPAPSQAARCGRG